ncbi:MAG: hypothetical protein V2B14_02700, partial [bacterium]
KRICFLSSQLKNQIMVDTINPPIHNPVITSSIPSHLDSPTPQLTAIVQTGQTAKDICGRKRLTVIKMISGA